MLVIPAIDLHHGHCVRHRPGGCFDEEKDYYLEPLRMAKLWRVMNAQVLHLAGQFAASEHMQMARQIFEAVGTVEEVREHLMDAVTGLSGSGPAYIFMVIEALTDAGVKQGLTRTVAHNLAAQTVFGAAKLALETGRHPAILKDEVTTPGGTTIAAIAELEKHGLRTMLIDAVATATERSRQLSEVAREG